jgi:LDH2 family malate/lactate/ureidoglycolate dehydrogenase
MRKADYKKYLHFCKEACMRAGVREDAADVSAKILVDTDMFGVYTHGTLNLYPYLKKVEIGSIDGAATPTVEREGPSWAVINGHNAMGMYTGRRGLEIGMEKAAKTGAAYIGMMNSTHYGACGPYAVEAAKNGFFALVMSGGPKKMTVPGARGPVISPNPMAYAVPAAPHKPVFFDIATSKIAGMKVNRAKAAGETLPDECIVDADGLPTNDPNTPDWALYPMGGHKGYGLALMIEILSSVLTGGRMLDVPLWTDLPTQDQVTHAVLLVNIAEIIGVEAFEERMQFVISAIAGAPKAKGSDRIYLPGEIEWERFEKAERQGMPLPDDVYDNMRKLADRFGLDLTACFV